MSNKKTGEDLTGCVVPKEKEGHMSATITRSSFCKGKSQKRVSLPVYVEN